MSTTTHPHGVAGASARPALSRAQKIGVVIAGLYSLTNVPPMTGPEGEVGPPLAIVVLGSVTGVLGVVAAVLAWRTRAPLWRRLIAGLMILNAVAALPAFFVPGVPLVLVVLAGIGEVIALVVVVLLFTGPRR
ncbi:hypothetical protein [Nocardioides sp. CFH 31398]|uniref:hypothetical protein n=1 Tax=Nocardioides sp. CFH 31398 TaxID=2919579 RepID=UPI001F054FDB|nr:hypothetical protein [Nocardioides sp. CFH 31398]MCH1864984.1 hypothetical protein [Nocardioides sp. CFH 31398]